MSIPWFLPPIPILYAQIYSLYACCLAINRIHCIPMTHSSYHILIYRSSWKHLPSKFRMNRRWFSHDFPRCSPWFADESAGFSHGFPSCWNHLASREVVPQWYCRLAELEPKPGVAGKNRGKNHGENGDGTELLGVFFRILLIYENHSCGHGVK